MVRHSLSLRCFTLADALFCSSPCRTDHLRNIRFKTLGRVASVHASPQLLTTDAADTCQTADVLYAGPAGGGVTSGFLTMPGHTTAYLDYSRRAGPGWITGSCQFPSIADCRPELHHPRHRNGPQRLLLQLPTCLVSPPRCCAPLTAIVVPLPAGSVNAFAAATAGVVPTDATADTLDAWRWLDCHASDPAGGSCHTDYYGLDYTPPPDRFAVTGTACTTAVDRLAVGGLRLLHDTVPFVTLDRWLLNWRAALPVPVHRGLPHQHTAPHSQRLTPLV